MMTVEPRRGVTAYEPREGAPVFLSDMIMELGLAEKEHVEAAVETARSSGETVGRILIREGRLSEDQMARAIAARYGLNHIDLGAFDVDAGAANLLPPAAAHRYRAVPVAFEADGGLVVAMADPSDSLALNDIAFMTKLEVHAAVAAEDLIADLVGRLPLPPSERGSSGFPTPAPAPAPPVVAPPPAAASPVPTPAAFEPPPAPAPAVDSNELAALRAELETTAAALDDERSKHAASVAELRQELNTERKQREELEQTRSEQAAAAGDSGEELERVRAKLTQKKEDLEQARAELAAKSEALEQARADLEQARSHAGDTEQSRADLDQARAELQTKSEELKQAQSTLDESRSELDRITDEAERARKELEKKNAELERAHKDLDEKGSELGSARSELGQKSSELDSARSELSQKSGELDHTRSELGSKSGELERARTDLAQKGGELEQVRAELEQNRGELERSRSDLDQNRGELAQARSELDQNRSELETARTEVARAGEALRRLDELDEAEARVNEAHSTVEKMRNDFELEREQHAVNERDLRARLASQTEQHEALQEAQAMMQKRVDALRAQNAALLDAYGTAKRWSAEFARGARELADTLEQPVLDDAVRAQQAAPGQPTTPPADEAGREGPNRFGREGGEDEPQEGGSSTPPPDWLS